MCHKDYHWCPNAEKINHNGKAKSVVYTFEIKEKKHFKCLECGSLFTKKQLKAFN